MEVWERCLDESLEAEVRGRIIGCQAQMRSFKFYYGINLGFTIYSITDNLSKTIQAENMSAIESQEVAQLSITTLESMRSESAADEFYQTTEKKADKLSFVEKPVLPRKRKMPNYGTLDRYFNVTGLQSTAEEYHPATVTEYYRIIYLDVLDTIITVIKDRFDQPSFEAYAIMESFLLKVIKGEDVTQEIKFIAENYGDTDVDVNFLGPEMKILKTIFLNDPKPTCFKDINSTLKTLSDAKKRMIPNIINICELIIVNPATSCTAERSFSIARQIKTWFRSTMTNKRFNNLTVLKMYKDLTDQLDLCEIGNQFVSKYDERFQQFGKFVAEDFM